jgi:hypothetical protein
VRAGRELPSTCGWLASSVLNAGRAMKNLELRFGSPEHGWLVVEVKAQGFEEAFDVSDVPMDSLAILANVALDLLRGVPDGEVPWSLEPSEWRWLFRVENGELRWWTQLNRAPKRRVTKGDVRSVGFVIWRALRRLAADPAWARAPNEHIWSHGFPHREVDALGRALKGNIEPLR